MQESWLEQELAGGKKDEFMKSSNVNLSAIPGESIGNRAAPPNPLNKQSTIVGPGSFPAVKEIDSDEGEDDLQIDKKPTNPANVPTKGSQGTTSTNEHAKQESQPSRATEPPKSNPKVKDPNEAMKKFIFKYNLAAIILGIVSSTLILFCFSSAYKGFDQTYFPFQAIKDSWRKDFILEITQKTAAMAACPVGFTPALNYQWPGSVEGCDCSKATGSDKSVSKTKCTDAQNTAGCKTSASVAPQNLTKWRDSKDEYLCVSRMTNVSMNTTILEADIKTKKCNKGFKVCPPPGDDLSKEDFGRRVCVPERYTECPISRMRILPCNLPAPEPTCFNRTVVKVASEMRIYTYTHCASHPTIDLSIGEDSLCRHELVEQIAANHTDYPLLRKQRSRCDQSENAFELDKLPQEEVFTKNGINLADLGLYSENVKTFNFSLFTVAPQKWVWEHRDKDDLKLIFENEKFISRLEG